jgi:hypothetical protein
VKGARGYGDAVALAGLDVLVFAAKKTGQIQSAIAHRVWYV